MLEKEREKLKTPLDKLTLSDLDKKPLMEYFVNDTNLLQEYKVLHKPIKQRFKFTIFWDLLWFLGLIVYARNAGYYASIYYPHRRKGLGNLMLLSGIHCFVFMATLAAGNCLVLRINPFKFWKKSKDINTRMIEQDTYKGTTWVEFMLLYAEIEEVEEKKAKLRKELKELSLEEKNIAL